MDDRARVDRMVLFYMFVIASLTMLWIWYGHVAYTHRLGGLPG